MLCEPLIPSASENVSGQLAFDLVGGVRTHPVEGEPGQQALEGNIIETQAVLINYSFQWHGLLGGGGAACRCSPLRRMRKNMRGRAAPAARYMPHARNCGWGACSPGSNPAAWCKKGLTNLRTHQTLALTVARSLRVAGAACDWSLDPRPVVCEWARTGA